MFRKWVVLYRAVSGSSIEVKRDIYHASIVKARYEKDKKRLKRKRDIERKDWRRCVRRRMGECRWMMMIGLKAN